MITTEIVWNIVCEVPDAEVMVLLYHSEESEPVWPGYFDGISWRSAEGRLVEPTHWAEMPEGPINVLEQYARRTQQ